MVHYIHTAATTGWQRSKRLSKSALKQAPGALEAFQLFKFTIQSGYGWAATSWEETGCSLLLEGSFGLTGAAPHG